MQRVTDDLDNSELDHMLRALKNAPIPTPADEIRQSLQRVSSSAPLLAGVSNPHSIGRMHWRSWTLAGATCAVIVGVGVHSTKHPQKTVAGVVSSVDRSDAEAQGLTSDPHERGLPPHRVMAGTKKSVRSTRLHGSTRQDSFTVELPYSNRDIANGTDAAISVQVSREELLALGYPVGDVTGDHKYLAEIALGDDGLPRSIRIPLPLKSID